MSNRPSIVVETFLVVSGCLAAIAGLMIAIRTMATTNGLLIVLIGIALVAVAVLLQIARKLNR